MCDLLRDQNHGELLRKLLRRLCGIFTGLGAEAFNACCARTLKRPSPCYEKLLEEIEIEIGPDKKLRYGLRFGPSFMPDENVRGADYYARVTNQKTHGEPK